VLKRWTSFTSSKPEVHHRVHNRPPLDLILASSIQSINNFSSIHRVSFIVSLNTAALSRGKPASAGISRHTCRAQGNKEILCSGGGFSTHPGCRNIAVANEFSTTLPHICGSSVLNLLRVSLQTPRLLRWFPDFCKVGAPCSVVAPDLHLRSNHTSQPRVPHISHFIIVRTYYCFMATTKRTR
jgi:hypothetical protein